MFHKRIWKKKTLKYLRLHTRHTSIYPYRHPYTVQTHQVSENLSTLWASTPAQARNKTPPLLVIGKFLLVDLTPWVTAHLPTSWSYNFFGDKNNHACLSLRPRDCYRLCERLAMQGPNVLYRVHQPPYVMWPTLSTIIACQLCAGWEIHFQPLLCCFVSFFNCYFCLFAHLFCLLALFVCFVCSLVLCYCCSSLPGFNYWSLIFSFANIISRHVLWLVLTENHGKTKQK